MPMYHAIHLDNNLVVRPVVDGITDMEWLHGCRCFDISPSEYQLKTKLKCLDDMHLLTTEEWKAFIGSLNDPGIVPNNNFKSTRYIPDKWDADRKVY